MDEEGAKEYRFAATQFRAWVLANGGPARAAKVMRAEMLVRLTTLRRLAAVGKALPLVEQADEFLSSTKRPLIIAGWHTDALETVIAGLKERGWRVGWVLGSTSPQARQEMIDEFQTGVPASAPAEERKYLDVLVCSIMAAGVGLTLTRSSDTMFLERAWTPSDLVQMEDRSHRIGTKNAVTITYYDATGTIDMYIAKMLLNKVSTAAAVIDGEKLSEEQAIDRVLGGLFGDFSGLQKNPEDDGDDDFDWLNGI
jgi:SWI/SNF-related matrix-associated actin-dependent regulator 1 of chromatin subfamily A